MHIYDVSFIVNNSRHTKRKDGKISNCCANAFQMIKSVNFSISHLVIKQGGKVYGVGPSQHGIEFFNYVYCSEKWLCNT